MSDNSQDQTLHRNYLSNWQFLISEYELVKAKKHPKYRFAGDLYRAHNINRQTFFKYYHRFNHSGVDGLIPRRRGAKPKQSARNAPRA